MVKDGALAALAPDDLTYPQAPPIEAARLGIYALTRLGSYEALASAVLDGNGQPISRWWPVAYALQRIGDSRANGALLTLLPTPGRYTAAFAAKGLVRMPSAEAVTALRQIVERRQAPGGRRHSGHAFAGRIGQCGRHAGAPAHRWRCHRRQSCSAKRR